MPSYLKDQGLDPSVATTALALIGLFNVFGSYAAGVLGSRFPKRYILAAIYATRSLAVVAFVLVPLTPLSVYVFASVMGLLWLSTVPTTNALLTEQFLQHFDGYSIGSNDLTQLTLGLDRDSGLVAHAFDERDPAVKQLLSMAINGANKLGKYVGICGQGPSDHADFAEWLMDEGIQTISLNPDTVVDTWLQLAAHNKGR